MSGADPLAFRFDERLREVPQDPGAFAAEVDRLAAKVRALQSDPAGQLAALGRAGPALRIVGRLDEARLAASAAVALAERLGDARAAFVNRIRLANVMQWQGRHDLATPLFERLVAQARAEDGLADLLDFALQHAGKDHFDQRCFAQAGRCFREALEIRQRKGDAALVESSAFALQQAVLAAREAEGGADC